MLLVNLYWQLGGGFSSSPTDLSVRPLECPDAVTLATPAVNDPSKIRQKCDAFYDLASEVSSKFLLHFLVEKSLSPFIFRV